MLYEVITHEAVQSTESFDQVVPGAQKQVVGIGEYNLGADLLERFGEHPLDRPLGADRHERRRFDLAPAGYNSGTSRLCVMTHIMQCEF